jgi:hypothetical protein
MALQHLDQRLMPGAIVAEYCRGLLVPNGYIHGLLGDVDSDCDLIGHDPCVPSLQMRTAFTQLFGLSEIGRKHAPRTHARAREAPGG